MSAPTILNVCGARKRRPKVHPDEVPFSKTRLSPKPFTQKALFCVLAPKYSRADFPPLSQACPSCLHQENASHAGKESLACRTPKLRSALSRKRDPARISGQSLPVKNTGQRYESAQRRSNLRIEQQWLLSLCWGRLLSARWIPVPLRSSPPVYVLHPLRPFSFVSGGQKPGCDSAFR